MPTNDYRRVLDDPAFQNLVRERSGFAWSLLAAMLIIYYGFIMLVAFAKPLLAAKVGGGVTSVGIVLGLAVIVSACVLTGLYVQRANSRFDELTRTLIRDLTRVRRTASTLAPSFTARRGKTLLPLKKRYATLFPAISCSA